MAKKFGKRYMQTKKAIYTMYDVISLVVVILSFDKLITSKTRTVEPKQVARLIEKLPKIKKLLYDSAPWWAFDDMDIKSK
jgi:hypothetical protein|tara:strand:+ start:18 stop:257 length:240 start_codon:yes stop_codon:yes gene_type:complete